MKEQLGISDEDVLMVPNYQNKYKQYKKELLRLKKKILNYEETNINLRTELKNANRMNALLQEQLDEIDERVRLESTKQQTFTSATEAEKTEEQRSLDELDRVIDAELSLSIGEIISEEKPDAKEEKMFAEEFKKLCEENEALRKGMHEILNSLNERNETSLREIKSETFEKLLRALDVKHISGWYHPAMRLQAEVHNVEGINKELREQLRMCRNEIEELRNEKQESLILLSKRSSVSSPRHLAHSSTLKDINTLESLNENVDQLIERTEEDVQACQEISLKIADFNEQFDALEKQLEDLQKKSLAEKRYCDEKIEQLESRNAGLDCDIQSLEAKLKVFVEDQHIDDSVKEIAELTAKCIRANLKKKYLEVECGKMREKIDELRDELLKSETDLLKSTAFWSRNERAMRNKIEILQAARDGAVEMEEHRKLKKELENLTIKFRELMEDFKKQSENNQLEIRMMKTSKQMCDDEKLELKNKLVECIAELEARPVSESADEHLQVISKKLSQCEIDVVGERQRANHINSLYELVKEQLRKSEERFAECEGYAKEIVRKNLILQSQLKETEDKLCDFIDVEMFNALKKEREKLSDREQALAEQVGKLQEDLQMTLNQSTSTSLWTSSKEEELLALKHQVVDLLSQSDDKATIARIGADLIQSRAAENELRHKCDVLSAQLEQCHDEWLESIAAIDEQRERFEGRETNLKRKTRLLQDILENQKVQYHGCVALVSEQRFIENMKMTLDNNHSSFIRLFEAQKLENEGAIIKELAEVEHKHFLDAQKIQKENSEGIRELLDWLKEKKHIELDLIRFRRQAEFKEILLQQCNHRIQIQNEQMAKLEEDLFLFHRGVDIKSLTDDFSKTKVQRKISQEIQDKLARFTKTQEAQTDEIHSVSDSNVDDETKRCESLKIELLAVRKELDAKEEIVQQLKTKLNETEMNVSLFRKQIGDKQSQISFYEKHILELQQQTKKEDEEVHRTQNDGGGDNIRNVAGDDVLALKATMKALQDTIVLKEESIHQYQSLLKEDRDNHSLAAARMQEEVKMLKNSLAEEKQKKTNYEEQSLEYNRSKAAIDQYVKQVHALEKHTDELHTQVTTMESQLQASMQEAVRWRSLANDRLKAIDEMRQSLEEQHNKELDVYKRDSEKWREEVLGLKDLINHHKQELSQVQPDLETALTAKDDKIQELTTMVRQLRDELQTESENEFLSKLADMEKIREQAAKENDALKKRFETLLRRERSAREEIRDLKGQLLKSKTSASARPERGERSLKDQLQKKNAALEEEIVRLKNELAAQVAVNESHRVKISEDFDRWKKQKQSQQIIERLRAKLNEKEAEMEKKDQTCSGYRSLIDRLEREKHNLENRIKAMKNNVNIFAMGNTQQTEALTAENIKLSAEIEELKAKLEIQQRHAGGLGAVMLQEKLEAQERKLAVLELSGKGSAEIRAEFERQQNMISSLQKANLFLEAKNIELKMDLEKTQKDFPRFKEQILHLENYIEVLKTERDKSARANTSTVQAQASKAGQESRRVNELERTVLILKRVVEKLQTDNKRLLSGKRPTSERAGSGEKLRRDFQLLKEQYEVSLSKISELQSALNSTSYKLRSAEDLTTDPEKMMRVSRELEGVRAQLEQKTQLLDKVKVLLHRAATREKLLLEEITDLKNQLEHGRTGRSVKVSTGLV
ncbi:hypothetical protein WA026_009146 [Henosepilachna vigintioctopunctata]|uniref:Centrosomal protein of 290 kDa n=1 Tax=Henosepilachna vigintioctopunctata TaxID=420089 RepID=A0AAW1UUU4_9CUCU